MEWRGVTDSTNILLVPIETICIGLGIGSLSSGSLMEWISTPFPSMNAKTRATYTPRYAKLTVQLGWESSL